MNRKQHRRFRPMTVLVPYLDQWESLIPNGCGLFQLHRPSAGPSPRILNISFCHSWNHIQRFFNTLRDSWIFLEILGNSWRFLKILPYVATHLKYFQKYSGIFTGLKHDTKIQLGNLQLENDQWKWKKRRKKKKKKKNPTGPVEFVGLHRLISNGR